MSQFEVGVCLPVLDSQTTEFEGIGDSELRRSGGQVIDLASSPSLAPTELESPSSIAPTELDPPSSPLVFPFADVDEDIENINGSCSEGFVDPRRCRRPSWKREADISLVRCEHNGQKGKGRA